jgi:uncharacterized protein YkwD
MAVGRRRGDSVGMSPIRRFALILTAGLVLAAAGGATPAAASSDVSVEQAESGMLSLINQARARHGLVPVRADARLMAIAGARARDMATKGYFSHTQPDGRNVFNLLSAYPVRWYSAGEVIAWNTWPGLADSAHAATGAWMRSTGHRHILMSRGYNYMGVGLAVGANGRKYWAGVFIKGPDRTGGWVRYATPRVARAATGSRRVSFGWSGGDVRLTVLTAGFHSFHVQRSVDGGAWVTVRGATTVKSVALTVGAGHTVQLRVRVRDRAGNYGAWRVITANA